MAGLKLMGNIGAFAGPGTAPPAASAGEAAFGPGYSDSSSSSSSGLLSTSPIGLSVWGGVAAVGALAFIRHSLPADRRSEFDLALMVAVLVFPARSLAKLSLQRLAQESQTQGIVDRAARAGIWLFS